MKEESVAGHMVSTLSSYIFVWITIFSMKKSAV